MSVSRRRVLQVGAGLGVAAAIPAAQHVAWGTREFVRAGYAPGLPTAPAGRDAWMNWSGLVHCTPTEIAFPPSEDALADLVATSRGPIRPVGSGHSNTGLVPTGGRIVDISALEGLIAFDEARGLATFGAGTRLFQLAEALHGIGRALPNLPDIDVQTLAGAFSTGTHGTGNAFTALHDYVAGFRIVLADGSVRDVTADGDPDLFAAGKVSLGALGIITRYTLKTVATFRLRRRLWVEPVETLVARAEELGAAHRNFEFFYFPGTGMVAALTHDLDEDDGRTLPSPSPGGDDSEFLAGLKALRDTFGWWPWLRRTLAQTSFPQGTLEEVAGESWALLSNTRTDLFNEMEFHIPRQDGIKTLRTVIAMLDRRREAFFPLEYRHIAADGAWLSPFYGGPRSSIAIHAAADEACDYFYTDFEPVFRRAGGRPHWGKMHSLTRADLAPLYPRFEDFLTLRRRLDPQGKFLNPYLAGLFGEAIDV